MKSIECEPPQALFLDRDGTLIRWIDYLCNPDEVELLPGIGAALKRAKTTGCLLFLHTNQSGVGRGYFEMKAVEEVNTRMFELLGVGRTFFDGLCIAPDHPDLLGDDSYRKPSPRFEVEMVSRFSLNLDRCFMLGDSFSDIQTGINAGMRSVLVRSEQTKLQSLPEGTLEFNSVAEFVSARF